ncbi:hypothetical protein PRIPAC_78291 [Pristionchus pacificus]|uniref:Uncharacterized protein n=1 Tax=Pristionchus pacificus TaxID=54126 RepID=A0A2A6BX75_PRIPA|nr:hypothetical protein PRIPAC_78291 [Pristionchus pacificus]|eukprot:PDM70505.1 hypothetical protein PRIPAC_46751 [Pristionchus pacificus]
MLSYSTLRLPIPCTSIHSQMTIIPSSNQSMGITRILPITLLSLQIFSLPLMCGYSLTYSILGPIISGTPDSQQFPLNHITNNHVVITGFSELTQSIKPSIAIQSEFPVQPHTSHTTKGGSFIDDEIHFPVANHPPIIATSNHHSIDRNHIPITGSIPMKNSHLIPLKFDAHHDPPDFTSIRDHTLSHTLVNTKFKCQVGENLITSMSD